MGIDYLIGQNLSTAAALVVRRTLVVGMAKTRQECSGIDKWQQLGFQRQICHRHVSECFVLLTTENSSDVMCFCRLFY